ncbi:MAG: glycosyltransferase family 87 protein [Planctomycetota bacterium]
MESRLAHALRRGKWVLIIAIVIFTVTQTARQIRNLHKSTHSHGGTALSDYLEAGRRAFEGDLYQINYSYPPAFAAAMAPLGSLAPSTAALIWSILQIAAAVFSIYLLYRLLTIPRPGDAPCATPVLVTIIGGAAAYRFLNNNLIHGNVNSFVLLAAILGAVDLYQKRDFRAGFWFAAAATIKFLPLFFGAVLVARRGWRALLGMVLSLILLNGVIPAILLGPARTIEISEQFYQKMIEPFYTKATLGTDPRNLALSAAIEEHFLEIQPEERVEPQLAFSLANTFATFPRFCERPDLLLYHAGRSYRLAVQSKRFHYQLAFRFPALSRPELNLISKLILAGISFITLVSVFFLARSGERSRFSILCECSLVMTCLLLVSPKTWTAHYVWLLPAQFALVWYLLHNATHCGSNRAAARRVLIRGITLIFILASLILALSSRGVVGPANAAFIRAASLETAAVLLFWGMLVFAARQHGARVAAATP